MMRELAAKMAMDENGLVGGCRYDGDVTAVAMVMLVMAAVTDDRDGGESDGTVGLKKSH